MAIKLLGIDHIDISVRDLDRSVAFYHAFLIEMGFVRISDGATVVWQQNGLEIAIRTATSIDTAKAYDRYRVGLHHLAFRAASRADVDSFYRFLLDQKVEILDPPADYPDYGDPYYALFFADPDGIKLELVYRC